MTEIEAFPASYRAGRERLLEAVSQVANRLPVVVDSRSLAARGPDGETLALDFVVVGARRPKRAVVVSSGTHGGEGFVGSAIQLLLAKRVLPTLALDADSALVLLHAINPYGFAWHRRVNEDNIDLNRNFRETFDPQACHADYIALYDVMNPTDLDPEHERERWTTLEAFVARHGMRHFQQVFSEGQYRFPEGLQYGGQAQAQSTRHLLDFVSEYFVSSKALVWLDIHTGLGESAACELISGAGPSDPGLRFARSIWSDEVRSALAGESLSTPLNGLLDGGIARALPAGCTFGMAFAEYGTHPLDRVMRALRADNWLHHHGDRADAVGRAIDAEMLEAFCPIDNRWREQTTRHGVGLVTQALAALDRPIPETADG